MRALHALAVRHPVRTTFVVALAVRLMVVISSHVLNQWPLIPDEMGYVELATLAADGRTNDYCCGGYDCCDDCHYYYDDRYDYGRY